MDKPVVDAIQQIAEARGVPMAQIALAWVLSKPVVSCPIVGATKPHHLQDAVAALDVNLTDDEIVGTGGAVHRRRTTIGGEAAADPLRVGARQGCWERVAAQAESSVSRSALSEPASAV